MVIWFEVIDIVFPVWLGTKTETQWKQIKKREKGRGFYYLWVLRTNKQPYINSRNRGILFLQQPRPEKLSWCWNNFFSLVSYHGFLKTKWMTWRSWMKGYIFFFISNSINFNFSIVTYKITLGIKFLTKFHFHFGANSHI